MSPDPHGATGPPSAVDAALRQARAGWQRLLAPEAHARVARGTALLLDTRTEAQRRRTGELPGAIVVDGVEGWVAAGLPLTRDPADVRE